MRIRGREATLGQPRVRSSGCGLQRARGHCSPKSRALSTTPSTRFALCDFNGCCYRFLSFFLGTIGCQSLREGVQDEGERGCHVPRAGSDFPRFVLSDIGAPQFMNKGSEVSCVLPDLEAPHVMGTGHGAPGLEAPQVMGVGRGANVGDGPVDCQSLQEGRQCEEGRSCHMPPSSSGFSGRVLPDSEASQVMGAGRGAHVGDGP